MMVRSTPASVGVALVTEPVASARNGTACAGGAAAAGGVPSHVRGPAPRERTLFDALEDPLTELGQSLLEAFAGQALRVDEVYERHGRGGPYTLAHYKDALKRLEEAGRVTAMPPAGERRARTMADHVVVGFRAKEV
jgi:hypothetical protein